MLYKPFIGAAQSGKIGGIVASHNAGGQYFRTFVVPTDPSTPQQNQIRNAVTNLSNRWVNILTAAQREGWATYAANVSHTNRLGDPINLSGLSEYVRSNVPRSQSPSLGRVDDAPTIFDLGEFTAPTAIAVESTQLLTVAFTDTDAWVDEDDSAMMVYASRPQNQTVNFFKGPYRIAGPILGDATTPPVTPIAIAAPFPFVEDQRIHFYVRVTRADGRLSGRNLFLADASA